MIEPQEETKEPKFVLTQIQNELKAPKNQRNNFGNYNYRNCEDILEALKPILLKYTVKLSISDKLITFDDIAVNKDGTILNVKRTAIKSRVLLIGKDDKVIAKSNGIAGIDSNRKGMDIAQSFGSSSSYARKYALGGMFLVDDTKDPDATNTHGKEEKQRNNKEDEQRKKLVNQFKEVAKGTENPKVKEMLNNIDNYSDNQIKQGIEKLKG